MRDGVGDVAQFLMLPALAWTLSSLIVAGMMPPRRRVACVGAAISFAVACVCYLVWMTTSE